MGRAAGCPMRTVAFPAGHTGAGTKARALARRVVPPYGMTHRMNVEKWPVERQRGQWQRPLR